MSRLRLGSALLVLVLAVAACACKKSALPAPAPDATSTDEREVDQEVKPVYPVEAGPIDALARRSCEALHALPATQMAKCCSTSPALGLAGECARTLTIALRDKASTVIPAELERCEQAMTFATKGCDWVTPLVPAPPVECRQLVHGQLGAGTRCRSALECKNGLACRGLGPTQPGVCAPPVAAGNACGGLVDTLAVYTRQVDHETQHPECDGFCARGRCIGFLAAGAACASDKQCGPGKHCARGKPPLGAHCAAGAAPLTKLKAAGEPCTNPFECQAACVKAAGAGAGTCGMKCSAWPPAGYPYPGQAAKKN